MATGKATPLILPNNCKWDQEKVKYTMLDNQERECLEIVPETLEMLRTIKGPVCVVAIAGPCRKGKSYILSKAFDQEEVFPLGQYMDPETMGIWLWIVNKKFKDSAGQEFTVVLMDSEGIDAANSQKTDDHMIFTLSVLLASVLIYNSSGVPTRTDLEGLDYIAKLSQRIKLHANQSTKKKDDSDFYKSFPHFIWLLRDTLLMLPADCNDIREYFCKKIFKSNEREPADTAQEVATSILKFFSGFDAFSLPVPSFVPQVVADLNNESLKHQINPAFLKKIEEFQSILLPKLAPKTSFNEGEFVTGEGLAALVDIYVNALNTPGAVPNVQSAWETFVENKCSEVKAAALHIYEQAMTSQVQGALPCDADIIRGMHREAADLAIETFRDETYEISAQSIEKYLKELAESAEKVLANWMDTNKKQTEEFCSALLTSMKKEYMEPVLARLTGSEGAKVEYADIVKAMNTIEKGYYEKAKGAKDIRATVFLTFHPELQQEMEKNMKFLSRLKDYDKKVAEEKAAIAAEKEKNTRIEERNAALRQEMKMKEKQRALLEEKQEKDMRRFEENLEKLRTDHQEQMTNMIQANHKELKREREAQKIAMDEMHATRITTMEKQHKESILLLQKHIGELQVKKDEERRDDLRRMKAFEERFTEKSGEVASLKQEMADMQRSREIEKNDEIRRLQQKVESEKIKFEAEKKRNCRFQKLFGMKKTPA